MDASHPPGCAAGAPCRAEKRGRGRPPLPPRAAGPPPAAERAAPVFLAWGGPRPPRGRLPPLARPWLPRREQCACGRRGLVPRARVRAVLRRPWREGHPRPVPWARCRLAGRWPARRKLRSGPRSFPWVAPWWGRLAGPPGSALPPVRGSRCPRRVVRPPGRGAADPPPAGGGEKRRGVPVGWAGARLPG